MRRNERHYCGGCGAASCSQCGQRTPVSLRRDASNMVRGYGAGSGLFWSVILGVIAIVLIAQIRIMIPAWKILTFLGDACLILSGVFLFAGIVLLILRVIARWN